MGVKINSGDLLNVPTSQMKDGEIAVIVSWPIGEYQGRVVQRYGNDLITVGAHKGEGWTGHFSQTSDEYRVRILPPETLLEIT